MSTSSRDAILNKLRSAQVRPFDDAPPRPKEYIPVTQADDESKPALIERFSSELTRLMGTPLVVKSEEEACATVLDLMRKHETKRILAWDFAYIPVKGLREAIEGESIEIVQPDTHDESRAEVLKSAEGAQIGLTGADAAAATTGSLIFTTSKGKGRIPTILAPVHIAVIRADQLVTRLETWFAQQRQNDSNMSGLTNSANFCFITGPSRTGDIEMELILGVHGPGTVYVVVIDG